MADRFHSEFPLTLGEHTIRGPDVHHISTVRRFQAGDAITLFHGDGNEYHAEILSVSRNAVTVVVRTVAAIDRELPHAVHLFVAMPKGDRGDFLVEKLTELGATSLTPLLTTRTVVSPKENRIENLRRAVIEASKQCGRNHLMEIRPPIEFRHALGQGTGERVLLHTTPTPTDWRAFASTPISLAIGPEGGFTADEVEQATASGWRVASLGPRVLRVETAAIAVVSRVQP